MGDKELYIVNSEYLQQRIVRMNIWSKQTKISANRDLIKNHNYYEKLMCKQIQPQFLLDPWILM